MPKVWNKRDKNIPEGAVYVGRPTRWGNQWRIGDTAVGPDGLRYRMTRGDVVDRYRQFIANPHHPERQVAVKAHLKGKDLVCWCAPLACHADVLLEIANET